MKNILLISAAFLLAHLISALPEISTSGSQRNDTTNISSSEKSRWYHVTINLQEVLPQFEDSLKAWVHTTFYDGPGNVKGLNYSDREVTNHWERAPLEKPLEVVQCNMMDFRASSRCMLSVILRNFTSRRADVRHLDSGICPRPRILTQNG
jgi:hypothetical protein